MKGFIAIFLVLLGFGSNAQDFLHFENGKTQEVKIFLLDKEKDIIGYLINNEKKYRSISSLKSYQLNSVLDSSNSEVLNDATELNGNLARRYDGNGSQYHYGKWSVSTDIWNLIPFNGFSIFTVEPEYEINPYFSLKIPLRFQIRENNFYNNYTRNIEDVYDYTYIINEPPTPDNYYYGYSDYDDFRNFKFQTAINPKFYPWGKSRDRFSFYLSPSVLYSNIIKRGYQNYYTLDTLSIQDWGGNYTTKWVVSEKYSIETNKNYTRFNFEFLVGGDIIFSKRVNATIELGLNRVLTTSTLQPNEEYISYFDVKNKPIDLQEITNYYYPKNRFVFRLLLTYRFGGELDVD